MIARRTLITLMAIGALAATASHRAFAAPPSSAGDPLAIIKAIYTQAAQGKGHSGGDFVVRSKAAREKYLSKAFAARWAKSEARTPNDGPGPVGFDPVTNSQDPDIASFTVSSEKQDGGHATIAATIEGRYGKRDHAEDSIIRYDLVQENGQWKIDDIRGAVEAEPWSIRQILTESLKR
jgi:hypothetical protein